MIEAVAGQLCRSQSGEPRGDDEKAVGIFAARVAQLGIDVGHVHDRSDAQTDTERFRGAPCKPELVVKMLGAPYDRNAPCGGCNFVEKLDPLGCQFIADESGAGEILARPAEGYGDLGTHRILADAAHNGNAALAGVEQDLGDVTSQPDQQIGPLRHQLAGQPWKRRRHAIRMAERHFDIAPLDQAALRHGVAQRPFEHGKRGSAECEPSDPEAPRLGLLRVRRRRPKQRGCRRAAQKRDETAAFHVDHGLPPAGTPVIDHSTASAACRRLPGKSLRRTLIVLNRDASFYPRAEPLSGWYSRETAMRFSKSLLGAVAVVGALALAMTGAAAHDETKYPDWAGQWKRPRGLATQWDQSKPAG